MNDILQHSIQLGHHQFVVSEFLQALAILLSARIGQFLVRRALRRAERMEKLDEGKKFMVRRLVSTIIWSLAGLLAMSSLGLDLTALWAGSAALLVGVGIGLQGFFNDVVSGFVLLFEGGVQVGNVLEVEGKLVRVERIDLRSTRVVTVAGELIVLPNSKVAGESVVNLSQGDQAMRIRVNVGVAYGSDVALVERLLAEAMAEQEAVRKDPEPVVFFQDFGESSLDFSVMGWLDDPWNRMVIQSAVRRAIDVKFREHGVTIPFPQRDIHVIPSPEADSLG